VARSVSRHRQLHRRVRSNFSRPPGTHGRGVVAPFPRGTLPVHASDYFLRHATGEPSATAGRAATVGARANGRAPERRSDEPGSPAFAHPASRRGLADQARAARRVRVAGATVARVDGRRGDRRLRSSGRRRRPHLGAVTRMSIGHAPRPSRPSLRRLLRRMPSPATIPDRATSRQPLGRGRRVFHVERSDELRSAWESVLVARRRLDLRCRGARSTRVAGSGARFTLTSRGGGTRHQEDGQLLCAPRFCWRR
jgi:hypothetical protein